MSNHYDTDCIRQDEINVLFVRREIDDAGLTPYEFRLYAHIVRRGNCWSKLRTVEAICKMSRSQVKRALQSLEEKGMINYITCPGHPNRLSITPPRAWAEPVLNHIQSVRDGSLFGRNMENNTPDGVGSGRTDPIVGGGVGSGRTDQSVLVGPGVGSGRTDIKGIPSKAPPFQGSMQAGACEPPEDPPYDLDIPHPDDDDVVPVVEKAEPPKPKPRAPRPRNILGEALLEACRIDPSAATEMQWGQANKAMKQIRDAYPPVTPADIHTLANALRKAWGAEVASFTPVALAKHWRPPTQSSPSAELERIPTLRNDDDLP